MISADHPRYSGSQGTPRANVVTKSMRPSAGNHGSTSTESFGGPVPARTQPHMNLYSHSAGYQHKHLPDVEFFPKGPVGTFDGRTYWKVQAIRDIAIQKNDIEVLLKWENFPESDCTWESLLDIGLNHSGLELLDSYKKKIIGDIKFASYRHYGYNRSKRKLKLVKMTIKLFKEKLAALEQSETQSQDVDVRSDLDQAVKSLTKSSEWRENSPIQGKPTRAGSLSKKSVSRPGQTKRDANLSSASRSRRSRSKSPTRSHTRSVKMPNVLLPAHLHEESLHGTTSKIKDEKEEEDLEKEEQYSPRPRRSGSGSLHGRRNRSRHQDTKLAKEEDNDEDED